MTTRFVLVAASAALTLLTSGCKSILPDCHRPQLYVQAAELQPLRMPVGLDGLDTRRALQIPQIDEPAVQPGPGDRCLDQPPVIITTSTPDAAVGGTSADAPQSSDRRRRPPLPR